LSGPLHRDGSIAFGKPLTSTGDDCDTLVEQRLSHEPTLLTRPAIIISNPR